MLTWGEPAFELEPADDVAPIVLKLTGREELLVDEATRLKVSVLTVEVVSCTRGTGDDPLTDEVTLPVKDGTLLV